MPAKSRRRGCSLDLSSGNTLNAGAPKGAVGGVSRAAEDELSRSVASPADAVELLSRMQDRTKEIQRAEKDADARENLVKTRYAGGASATGGTTVPFDKNALLTDMIAEARYNFLKLDQNLSEDYNIATRRLHAAVFGHTSDFLQLFRDVNRASSLVESLKSSVQGTKAVISTISKSATCGRKGGVVEEGTDACTSSALGFSMFSSGLGCSSGSNDDSGNRVIKPRTRPSLIATNLARRQPRRGLAGAFAAQPSKDTGTPGSGAGYSNSTGGNADGRGWSRSGGCLLVTTRSLNTTSVSLWQTMILSGGESAVGDSALGYHHRWAAQRGIGEESDDKVEKAKSQDIAVFVDVLRQEVMQSIAERRYMETAELLRSSEAEADAKGCLSLVLELEELLVHSIRMHVQTLVMPLMYSESLHIPLIQLLLRFGRVQCGSQLFFHLHAVWLDAEMEKLQLRLDSYKGTLIASDFLVCAILEVLERQKNLWRTDPSIGTAACPANDSNEDDSGLDSSPKAGDTKLQRTGSPGKVTATDHNNGCTKSEPVVTPRMPPSSTAVLWVHDRLDKFACEVLQPRALSHGTGAEGGDPSRFRRAVVMAADAIRTVRRLDRFGFAGCDTRLLVLLTPSLMYLQADFSRCTNSRLATTGRAMIEHLIHDVRHIYLTKGKGYSVKMCGEVARRNNSVCREPQQRLKILPRSSYALLAELLLAPASSRLFMPQNTGSCATRPGESSAGPVLVPEQYSFLRYSNGCTRVHGLLLTSVLRFVAAMTGYDVLPLELAKQQQQEALEQLANQAECASFLLSNSLVIESLDVTLHRLFLSLMHTTIRQRQSLVGFMLSGEFSEMHPKFFDCGSRSSSSTYTLVGNPWALSAMQLMLADVLSTSVWIAYLSRGGALSQLLLLQSAQAFRVQYVEELRRALPRIVQGWMAATLSLGYRLDSARDLLPCDALVFPVTEAGTSTAPMTMAPDNRMVDASDPRDAVVRLLEISAVNESRLAPFLLSLVQNSFTSGSSTAEEAVLLCAPLPMPTSPLWCLRSRIGNYPKFPIGRKFNHDDELFLFHLFVQIMLNVLAYFQEHLLVPSYVVNERWASARPDSPSDGDTSPQSPGYTSKRCPSRGCVSPQTESVVAILSAGGGNYVGAVALLQFIIYRLLRDVLCRPQTWNVVYGLPPEASRWAENMVRQQVFFFALFVRFWSPLFVGGVNFPVAAGRPPGSGSDENADGISSMLILQWLTCTGGCQGKQQHGKGPYAFDIEALAFPPNTVESRERVYIRETNLGGVSGAATPPDDQQSEGAGQKEGSRKSAEDSTTGSDFSPPCTPNEGKNDLSMLMLGLIGSFFDSQGEARAMPAINSDLTRNRVEKLMSSLNLLSVVNKEVLAEKGGAEGKDSDDDDEDREESPCGTKEEPVGPISKKEDSAREQTFKEPLHSRTGGDTSKGGVTLFHVYNMLLHYLAPLT
ncbi:hypothetical protein DPX39_070062200 [Trypanosoma brucei equiperdum]|uniref:Uncharacterized protein n=1 Tax=Trypanosoma brucei equiperdum TaxID=630700 RepID=A0A3L6LBH5_9TRYP|nr:hypothetical protein DPX39_070062200 [Trypanosoma brucei equiperdum]